MKIAIFGDSFADERIYDHQDTNLISWIRHLRTRGYDIDNYAKGGSSLIFSYNNYLENKHKYTSDDLAIFLVTSKGRLWLKNQNYVYEHMSGINYCKHTQVELLKDNTLPTLITTKSSQILDSVERYYHFLYDEHQDSLIGESLLRSILLEQKYSNVFSNMLFISCFELMGYQIPNITGDNITIVDNLYLHEDIAKLDELKDSMKDHRLCHMNPENSEIFANMIEQWITTGKFNVDKNKFKSTKPWYNKILESV
jgi:hypothetical protein